MLKIILYNIIKNLLMKIHTSFSAWNLSLNWIENTIFIYFQKLLWKIVVFYQYTLYTHTKWFCVCKCAYVQKWMENSSTKCAIEMRNLKNFSIFHSLQYFHCNLNVYVYYCVWKAMFVSIYMKVIQMFYKPTYSHIYGKGYYFLFIASHMLYYKTKHQNQAFCIEN